MLRIVKSKGSRGIALAAAAASLLPLLGCGNGAETQGSNSGSSKQAAPAGLTKPPVGSAHRSALSSSENAEIIAKGVSPAVASAIPSFDQTRLGKVAAQLAAFFATDDPTLAAKVLNDSGVLPLPPHSLADVHSGQRGSSPQFEWEFIDPTKVEITVGPGPMGESVAEEIAAALPDANGEVLTFAIPTINTEGAETVIACRVFATQDGKAYLVPAFGMKGDSVSFRVPPAEGSHVLKLEGGQQLSPEMQKLLDQGKR